MKIALVDLNHKTCGIHNNVAPLALGMICSYLKKKVDLKLDLRLFKEIDKTLEAFQQWVPDVLGISQYCWNSELNLYIARFIKKKNPNCIIIAGGPNLELSKEGKYHFLKDNCCIDFGISYDAEIPFAEILRRLLAGEMLSSIKKTPPPGSYALTYPDQFNESQETPPRLPSLDVLGTIYSEGLLDEFLKAGYHPFLQTNQGCPFSCAFCHTSDPYYSHMIFLSPKLFEKEMDYLGKMFKGRKDVFLQLADTNMSTFNQDFTIAEIIKKTKEKYDWPEFVEVSSGKNPQKLLNLLSIIRFQPSMALQTLTPQVLKNINRCNLSLEDYSYFQKEILLKTGEMSTTELILSLPGETKESFLESLKKVLDSGVQNIIIYTLMNLKGTPLASKNFSKKYCHLIRHRVVPRQFSEINGDKIFDTEEVVVGTKFMPFKDYLYLRGVSFIVSVFFSSAELIPLKRFLFEYQLPLSEWVFNLYKNLPSQPNFYSIYKEFLKETKEELFSTRESLIRFFNQPENFNDLLKGRRGDNLIRKYKYLVLSGNFDFYLQFAISEAKKLAYQKLGKEKAEPIDDLEIFLSTRNMVSLLKNGKIPAQKKRKFRYDIPNWLKNTTGIRLDKFKYECEYSVEFDFDVKKKLDNLLKINKDPKLSLQILYRDGDIKNLWPKWTKLN